MILVGCGYDIRSISLKILWNNFGIYKNMTLPDCTEMAAGYSLK